MKNTIDSFEYSLIKPFQVLRAQLELGQTKQEIDRKIAEKEEEFENTRFVYDSILCPFTDHHAFQQKPCKGHGLHAGKS